MSSKSLLSIALFLCINGVLSSKHKHHNKHNKAVEADYSSPLADDQQFADKEFLPKGFFPTSGSKDGALPTLEGHALPTLEKAGDDNALPTFEGQALPTPGALDDDSALPTFGAQALPTDVVPTVGEDGLFPSLVNKNMNVNIHGNNNTSNGNFMTKLLLFSVISSIIVGLYLFYKKRYNNNNSKYISISQDNNNEHEELGDIESQRVTKYVEDIGERTALL